MEADNDIAEDDFYEISHEEEEEVFFSRKKRKRRYTSGNVQKKNVPKRKEKLSPKLLLIKRTILWGGSLILILLLLSLLSVPLYMAKKQHDKEADEKPSAFLFSPAGAQELAETLNEVVSTADLRALSAGLRALSAETPHLEASLKRYEELSGGTRLDVKVAQPPLLVAEHHPNYYALETSNKVSPLYIIEEEGRHVVDLEASVGLNEFSLSDINNFTLKETKSARLTLRALPEASGEIYGRLEASLPFEQESFILYYRKDSSLAHSLEPALRAQIERRVLGDLSLFDLTEPKRYFLSSLKKFSWVR